MHKSGDYVYVGTYSAGAGVSGQGFFRVRYTDFADSYFYAGPNSPVFVYTNESMPIVLAADMKGSGMWWASTITPNACTNFGDNGYLGQQCYDGTYVWYACYGGGTYNAYKCNPTNPPSIVATVYLTDSGLSASAYDPASNCVYFVSATLIKWVSCASNSVVGSMAIPVAYAMGSSVQFRSGKLYWATKNHITTWDLQSHIFADEGVINPDTSVSADLEDISNPAFPIVLGYGGTTSPTGFSRRE